VLKIDLHTIKNHISTPVKIGSVFILICLLISVVALFTNSTVKDEKDKAFQQEINQKYAVFALPLPDKYDFAGEDVPMGNFDVREAFDRELLVNVYWQSQTLLFFKRANRYFSVIEPILKQNDVPDDMKYLAVVESGLMNVTSPAGAKGVWQFIEVAAKQYKLEVSNEVDERYHLEKSTQAACRYFQDSYKIFKSWTLVAASYNIGMGALQKQTSAQNVSSFYDLHTNEETSRYIYRILAVKYIMENPRRAGFHFRKKDLYPHIPLNEVKVDTSISDLIAFAEKQGVNYKMLKYFNPWLRKTSLNVKSGNSYFIKIPASDFRTIRIEDGEFPADSAISAPSQKPVE